MPLPALRMLLVLMALVSIAERAGAADADSSSERPNILFIYTDDHSYRTIGCYPESHDWVRTPSIDALAADGVRFTHAYIGTWCMPSRATLLTGHFQWGIESMRMQGKYPGSVYDPAQCPFWPAVFRQQGYTTAHIGKWHTGVDAGYGRDWDYQAVWNRPRHPDNAGAYYYNQLISFNGGEPTKVDGYSTDNYTDWAEAFIRGEHRAADKPWYLWLCYGGVHGPYTPAQRHRDAYANADVPTPKDIYPKTNRQGKPQWMQQFGVWQEGPDGQPIAKSAEGKPETGGAEGKRGKTLTDWVRQYNQGVLALDEGVGRLMKTLEETGQLDNTLVIFTADQGFAWGQHGMRNKLAAYDAAIRAPLIVRMPGRFASGEVCRTPVGGVDLVPTIFSVAGLELPWEMHGRDLSPLLKDPAAKWEHPMLLGSTYNRYGSDCNVIPSDLKHGGIPWWVMIVEGRYKYIRSLIEGEVEELYDLQSDPEELNNLALSAEYAERVAQMRETTLSELRRTKAGMVDNLPAVAGQ